MALWVLETIGVVESLLIVLTFGRWTWKWRSEMLWRLGDHDTPVQVLRAAWVTRQRPERTGFDCGRAVANALACLPERLLVVLSLGRAAADWSWTWDVDRLAERLERLEKRWCASRLRSWCRAPGRWHRAARDRKAERLAPTMRTYWHRVPVAVQEELYRRANEDDGTAFEHVNNLRAAPLDDPEWVAAYARTRNRGCCGYYEDTIVVDGRIYQIGFNIGH